jgi:hypothetical protein
LFVDEPIPAFEINSQTIEILSGLVDINKKKDRHIKILIEDFAEKREECRSEGLSNQFSFSSLSKHVVPSFLCCL